MQYILSEEEINRVRQADTNLAILHNTLMKFKDQAKDLFECFGNCDGCLFEGTSFDGTLCLAGFEIPKLQKDDNNPTK